MSRIHLVRRAMFVALALAVFPVEAGSEATDPAKELLGLWAARRDFTPDVQGLLTVRTADNRLLADIAGYSVTVSRDQTQFRFELPGDRGYFRGKFADNKQRILGHWVQPWTHSSFAPFASPVSLEKQGEGHWQGLVTPLTDELHFYLAIEEREDGKIGAFIRNPEANIGRFYRIANIEKDGSGVKFKDGKGSIRLEGSYYADSGQLSIFFGFNGGSFDFVRVDKDSGTRFFPRPAPARNYHYSPPLPGGGWNTASIDEVNMSIKPIEDLMKMIMDTPMDSIDAPYIHALLVARHGKLVVEEYFHGYSKDVPHATRSAAKSITTTLVGMAVHQGIVTLDTPVYGTMIDAARAADVDPRAHGMQLHHLITMTSGLACDDSDSLSPGGEDRMQEQKTQPDWQRFTLDLPMVHEPGEHAAYCSGGQNLAGGVLAKMSGEWLPDFFRKYFAEPLKTGLYHMNLTPVGEGYGGGGLFIKPRDFLKLGQLYLDDGKWEGRRLLPPGWVAAAFTPHNTIWNEGYGYGWWIFSYPYQGRGLKAIYAGGNGGQYVIVIPELDLNIVGFGGNYNQKVMHKPKYEYVRDYILPAVIAEKGGQ